MRDTPSRVSRKIDAIEAEMKRIGYWSETPLPEKAYDFHEPFGADTMSFAQWLQFVLIPRVREILAEKGEFPPNSQVGAYAVHEFDGSPEAGDLSRLLCEFDQLFS